MNSPLQLAAAAQSVIQVIRISINALQVPAKSYAVESSPRNQARGKNMGSSFWGFVGAIVIVAIISDGLVRIIRASKSGGSKQLTQKIEDLEEDIALLEQELEDSKRRIEVLEKIVTDEKDYLSRQIDDLANNP
jgi:Tfp pilus assembly protein PilN